MEEYIIIYVFNWEEIGDIELGRISTEMMGSGSDNNWAFAEN